VQLVAVAATAPHVAVPAVTVYPVTEAPTVPAVITGAAQVTTNEPLDVDTRLVITGAAEGAVHFEVVVPETDVPVIELYALNAVTETV
jgi:hypothetical protein